MKKLKKIFTFIIMLSLFTTNVSALGENGGSNGGGTNSGSTSHNSGGPGEGGDLNDNTYDKQWAQNGNMELAAYRFDLVYKPKNGERKVIKTIIVQGNESYFNSGFNTWVWEDSNHRQHGIDNFKNRTKAYASFLNTYGKQFYGNAYKGATYIHNSSCKLEAVVNKMTNGTDIQSIIVNSTEYSINNQKNIEHYLTSASCFGLSAKDFQLEQDYSDNNGKTITSYGYRILIQKIQLFTTGAADSAIEKQCASFAATRSDVADSDKTFFNKMIDYYKGLPLANAGCGAGVYNYGEGYCGSSNFWHSGNLNNTSISIAKRYANTTGDDAVLPAGDLFTNWGDIGIEEPTQDLKNKLRNATKKESYAEARLALNDSSMRSAFGNKNNGLGYNIIWFSTQQFVPDYSLDAACVNCDSNDKDNKSYYIQDTTNWDAIKNSKNYESSNKTVTSYINNYFYKTKDTYCRESYLVRFPNITNTIKVETGRYFTLNASENDLKEVGGIIPNFKPVKVTKTRQCKGGDLNAFAKKTKNAFLSDTGTVYVKYTENTPNSKYSSKEKIELKRYSNSDEFSSNISGDMLTMTATYSYTLPDNFYRYVRKSDGLSLQKINTDTELDKTTDLKVSNFPISFSNHSNKAAEVQFSYELPSKDSYSKIKEAFNEGKNNRLKDTDNKLLSTYKNYYLTYMEKSKSSSLWEDKNTVAIQNSACSIMFGYQTEAFNSCVKQRQTNNVGDGDNNCYTKINKAIDSNQSTSGYSCIVSSPNKCRYDKNTGKFYNSAGKEISETDYNNGKCDSSDGDDGGTCKIVYNRKTGSTDYYGPNGEKVSKDEYNKLCPCPNSCEYGCCPSGECAPMPRKNGMIVCPVGGKRVIYRTIDLIQPFPGQSSSNRATGSNWCSYDIKTQKIDCKWNNNVSKTYILNEGKTIHSDNHVLYNVKLDSKTISTIRNYNKKHKYDDFTLKCKNNGKACISTFLKEVVSTTGKCANKSTASQFDSCNS